MDKVNRLREVVSVGQYARLMMFADDNKYRNELSIWDEAAERDQTHNETTGEVTPAEQLERLAGVTTHKKIKRE